MNESPVLRAIGRVQEVGRGGGVGRGRGVGMALGVYSKVSTGGLALSRVSNRFAVPRVTRLPARASQS